jgi:ATP-dependent Lon protease
VKEQLNKRKADDEFAEIRLGYVNSQGESVEVHCPESRGILATLDPRGTRDEAQVEATATPAPAPAAVQEQAPAAAAAAPSPADSMGKLVEKHLTIRYGDTGYSYRSIFGDYLRDSKRLVVEDPYIRRDYQIRNFLQLCELAVEIGTIKTIELVTASENELQKAEAEKKLDELKESLADCDVVLTYRFDDKIDESGIRTDTGWNIQIDRGLGLYQDPMVGLKVGSTNYDLRPCMETNVKISRTANLPQPSGS